MPQSIRLPTINKAVTTAAKYAVTHADPLLAQAQIEVLLHVALALDLPCISVLTAIRQQPVSAGPDKLMALLDKPER